MESTYSFLLAGVVFGLSSGIAPGPMLTLTISETIRHGLSAGLRISIAPLFTDGPIIVISLFLLSRLSNQGWFYGSLSFVGGLALMWFAWECLSVKPLSYKEEQASYALKKGIAVNLLNPAPYLFWFTIGTPTLVEAWDKGSEVAFGYLGGFFVCIMGAKLGVAFLTSRFRDFLASRFYLSTMRLMGIALLIFALVFLKNAGTWFKLWS